jgi:Flp pilus assembly protein TadB
MPNPLADSIDRWLKWAQFCMALGALMAALTYAGQRSERDEQQTRALDRMAFELTDLRKEAQEGMAQVRILAERVRGLEERMTRLERKP